MQDGLEDRIMRVEARLADARALCAVSAVEYCDYLQSPGMMPCCLDDFSQMQTFTWTGREYIPDCESTGKSTVEVQPIVESSLNASVSHCEIMTASSRDKGSHIYGIRVYLPQPPESSNGTSTGMQTLFWKGTD